MNGVSHSAPSSMASDSMAMAPLRSNSHRVLREGVSSSPAFLDPSNRKSCPSLLLIIITQDFAGSFRDPREDPVFGLLNGSCRVPECKDDKVLGRSFRCLARTIQLPVCSITLRSRVQVSRFSVFLHCFHQDLMAFTKPLNVFCKHCSQQSPLLKPIFVNGFYKPLI